MKMRVLHITPAYVPAKRQVGAIESVHILNKALVEQGVDVTVYTTDFDGSGRLDESIPRGEPVEQDGVRVYYFSGSFPRRWYRSRALKEALRENMSAFDLVHITSVFLSPSLLGARSARKYGIPYVISPRGSLMKEPIKRKGTLKKRLYLACIERRNLKKAVLHFTVPLEYEEYKAQRFPMKNHFILPNALAPEAFAPGVPRGEFRKKFRIAPGSKLVLFLGRINWKKGLDTLVPAFRRVSEGIPNSLLALVGGDDGGYLEVVKRLVNENKLQNNVLFTGMLRGKERVAAFQDADVFVLPSYAENFGQTVLEAMHFGLPVVVTTHVGTSPYVTEHKTGLVVEKDEKELATALFRLLRDPILTQEIGQNGQKISKTLFSPEKISEQCVAEYRRIVESKNG